MGVCELENGNVEQARNVRRLVNPSPSLAGSPADLTLLLVQHFIHLVSAPANADIDLSAPYLYLAQLSSTPQESLAHFESAIRSLETQLAEFVAARQEGVAETEDEKEVERELRAQICGALVGMTEVYLTDLW